MSNKKKFQYNMCVMYITLLNIIIQLTLPITTYSINELKKFISLFKAVYGNTQAWYIILSIITFH